jgi:hypothetical protein
MTAEGKSTEPRQNSTARRERCVRGRMEQEDTEESIRNFLEGTTTRDFKKRLRRSRRAGERHCNNEELKTGDRAREIDGKAKGSEVSHSQSGTLVVEWDVA